MIMEKLLSKRGQVSMEIGILVAAAIAVAAIAAYFYVVNIQQSASRAGNASNATIQELQSVATGYAQKMKNLTQ